MTGLSEDDDLKAAEYVLGTLDASERQDASLRLSNDAAFGRAVDAWEDRLAPLSEHGDDVVPPPHLWPAILARLGLTRSGAMVNPDGATIVTLHRQLRAWRRATAGVSALAACLGGLALFSAFGQVDRQVPRPLVAFLQKTDDAPAYVVKADFADRSLSVRSLTSQAAPGRSYELWMIDPSLAAPMSLGTIDGTPPAPRSLPSGVARDIVARATFAVTDEPQGGSVDGKPSGKPLFIGHLVPDPF